MSAIQDLIAEVDGMGDVVSGVIAALDHFADEVEGNAGSQAAVQGSVDKIRTYRQALAEAIVRNTEADTTPAPSGDDTIESSSGNDSITGAERTDSLNAPTPEGNGATANVPDEGPSFTETSKDETKSSKTTKTL